MIVIIGVSVFFAIVFYKLGEIMGAEKDKD